MEPTPASGAPDLTDLITFIQSVFSNLNVGLLVYHLEDVDEAASLRLRYANEEASTYTESDLQRLVGKTILEAFPALADTELPQTYAQVARDRHPRELGTIAYADENLEKSYYAVKAFPMPHDCVGVLFENIALRKKVEAMVKHLHEQLKQKNRELETLAAAISKDLDGAARAVQAYTESVRHRLGDGAAPEEQVLLEKLTDAAGRLTRTVDALLEAAKA
jgi:signal transduction histidine kinase